MTTWWYAKKDKKPCSCEEKDLTRLIQNGKIGSKTMLWKDGMESWLPLDEINELREVLPPPLPPKVSSDPLTYPMASRWSRFFARTLDIWWEGLAVAIIVGVSNAVEARFFSSINILGFSSNPIISKHPIILGMIILPFALFLDALVYKVAGNTPGKALLGLKVGLPNASPLRFGQYLHRNFLMRSEEHTSELQSH